MELKHLRTFVVAAELSGFTKAAEQLGYVQSSVTAQIQALEEELGVPLFDRLGKTVVLTENGRRLLPYAKQMLQWEGEAKALFQPDGPPSGTITIGAPESLAAYRLPQVVMEYRSLFPQVKVILKPGQCWELRTQVRSGQADLALLLEPEAEAPDLEIESLVREPMVLIAPLSHPLVKQARVEPVHLQHETLLHTEPGCSYRGLFDSYLQSHGIQPAATMEFWNIEAIKNCVMSGLGVALLPRIAVASELRAGRLAALRWDNQAVQVSTQLVYHRARWMSPAVREFLSLLRKHAAAWRQERAVPVTAGQPD
ncbi:LysR family transcriptional regulator [Alicyclobacillus contaminans]|uniref:LysR family transcriptional regulator n=1 Tax=Alicyclobacillus contaminans TaxID=392016 RepID=UPI0003F7EADC|nr:LysR family transcriptional regulator [Alicyclobacillus contaminans]GMA50953.1 LysR family transcriptional regulator [Alicyclobacillus contaminans]